MKLEPEKILDDFLVVAHLAHVTVPRVAVDIECLDGPHVPPTGLPDGKMAVYVFSDQERVLKVGKANVGSGSRYGAQSYTGTAPSTIGRFLREDQEFTEHYGLMDSDITDWIAQKLDRVNFLLNARLGPLPLTLLEAFVQCRLKPKYEGKGG